jgi:hypothetical protein
MKRRFTNSLTHKLTNFVLLVVAAAALVRDGAAAQTRYMYLKGESVAPAYEGWWPNPDGSFTMFFGYMNSNWEEEFDVPIGPDNTIEPGGPDQGQPTHFYPRRNPFLFTVRIPKDFGTKELIWTLTTHGKTLKAYASLKSDYQIDPQTISTEVGGDGGSLRDELRTNVAPELSVEGEKQRRVKVGEALPLAVVAKDPDNIPARRPGRGGTAATSAAVYRPPQTSVMSSPAGLRFSWLVYRGKASKVTFSPEQMKTWTDSRAYANSPWSPPYILPEPPPNNRWVATATFAEPGTYVLRGVASDGSLFAYDNITVTVTQ